MWGSVRLSTHPNPDDRFWCLWSCCDGGRIHLGLLGESGRSLRHRVRKSLRLGLCLGLLFLDGRPVRGVNVYFPSVARECGDLALAGGRLLSEKNASGRACPYALDRVAMVEMPSLVRTERQNGAFIEAHIKG